MNTHDDDLRRLLEDAVADVHPAAGLDAVRARTARARHCWVLPALGSAVLVAAVVVAFLLVGPSVGPGAADLGADPGRASGAGQASDQSGSPDWYMGWPEQGDDPALKGDAGAGVSSVAVATPTPGATVTSPFTVKGSAATFEGNVTWKLLPVGGDATRARTGFTTASECCTAAPYSFVVTAPPGDYVLVVGDQDQSDDEGTSAEVRRQITVR